MINNRDLSAYAKDMLGVILMQLDSAADDLRRLRDGAQTLLPSEAGEVSPSHGDGGVISPSRVAHDPSVREDADTSPRFAQGGEHEAGRSPALPAHEYSDIIDGEFQSDKYPTTPRGKVPLSTKDPMAQDLLWQYAQRRRSVDGQFADDLERALKIKGYFPNQTTRAAALHARDMLALARLLEAVTPTVDTMRAYRGQFIFDVNLYGELARGGTLTIEVPSDTIAEILTAIRKRAGIDTAVIAPATSPTPSVIPSEGAARTSSPPPYAQRGEVSPSHGDGGVISSNRVAHDPSVGGYADTSPREAQGGEHKGQAAAIIPAGSVPIVMFQGPETTLRDCPPGLFTFGPTFGFKSEYHTQVRGFSQTDAYVLDSGEYFWGGTSDQAAREALIVHPVTTMGVARG